MRVSGQIDRRKAIDAAMGRIPCDLAVINCNVVNVLTGDIYPAAVKTFGDLIVDILTGNRLEESVNAKDVYDADGAFLIPGFVDTHIHVESTMMTPERFAEAVIPWGTTTVISDPHEIANVMGKEGVLSMLANAKGMPLRHFFLVPSCVPSNPPFETGGNTLGEDAIESLLGKDEVLGLGEVMDFPGVIRNDSRMVEELRAALGKGAFIQGHAPMLSGRSLSGYLASGVQNDHECRSGEECVRKLQMGMHIDLKSSSLSDNLQKAVQGIASVKWKDNISFCTDDLYAATIQEKGHINKVFGEAVGYGLDPLDGIRFATYNAAREYDLQDLGVIAPGYVADFQVVHELNGSRPKAVFIAGRLVAKEGSCLVHSVGAHSSFGECSVKLPVLSPSDFQIPARQGHEEIFTLRYKGKGGHFNDGGYASYPVHAGVVDITGDPNISLLTVINRYGKKMMGRALFQDSGLVQGAYATTISHDCHNLLVVSRDPDDALLASEVVERIGGGFAAVVHGTVLCTLPLPVGGLMSDTSVQEIVKLIKDFEQESAVLFSKSGNILRFATCALPVLPGFVVTDQGIIDGAGQKNVPLYR